MGFAAFLIRLIDAQSVILMINKEFHFNQGSGSDFHDK